jgi:hypothetical protein
VDELDELFNDFMWATKHDNRLKAILAEHDIHTPCCEAWASFDQQFHPLRDVLSRWPRMGG